MMQSEKRQQVVEKLTVQGILPGQSPMLTQMARGVARDDETIWPTAKRLYRSLRNQRFSHRDLLEGLYGTAQRMVAEHTSSHLGVDLDPENFEKPYTEELEGVSTAMKSTPPGPKGKKRLRSGYPTMTATVVNMAEPEVTYANWFSYRAEDFVSENSERYRATRTTRALFPQTKLRFVGNSGLDAQKIFRQVDLVNGEFIIQARQIRRVEVHNDRLDCAAVAQASGGLCPCLQSASRGQGTGLAQDPPAANKVGAVDPGCTRPSFGLRPGPDHKHAHSLRARCQSSPYRMAPSTPP